MKKRIFVAVFSLLLFVTASFAWINDYLQPEGRYMTFSFKDNQAVITSTEIAVRLYYDVSGDDEFVEMTSEYDIEGENSLALFSDFAPGDQKKFRVDVTNTSDTPLSLRVVFADIKCDNAVLREHIEIGTSGYEGFPSTALTPKLTEKTLAQGLEESNFTLVENVEIPPSTKVGDEFSQYSIYFYVTLSRAATETTANQQFTIGKMIFMAI